MRLGGIRMAVEDRLISVLAEYINQDENAISLDDPIWSTDGGYVDDKTIAELLDELEGEFGIDISTQHASAITTVGDLLHMIEIMVAQRGDS